MASAFFVQPIIQKTLHMKFDKEKSQMAYDLWNTSGRATIGNTWDIMVSDRKYFPHYEEAEITFEIHDGFAVGCHEGREYLMLYPAKADVLDNPAWLERVENYVGEAMVDETGLALSDIALTFGKIVSSRLVLPVLYGQDTVVRLDADIMADDALYIINTDIRQDISRHYGTSVPEVDSLPEKDNGHVIPGYLVLRADSGAQFILQPKDKTEVAALEEHAASHANYTTLSHYIQMRDNRETLGRISDVTFTSDSYGLHSVSCRIDGIQMPPKPLTPREGHKVQQHIARDLDPMVALSYPVLLKKYAAELKGNESLGHGVKRVQPTPWQQFRKALNEKYPDGVTLQVFGLHTNWFRYLAGLSEDLQSVPVTDIDNYMPVFEARISSDTVFPDKWDRSTFHATVKVTPDMYDYVLPQMLSDTDDRGLALLDASAKRQMELSGGDLEKFQLQIPECLQFRQTLSVEGVPYRQALQIFTENKFSRTEQFAEFVALNAYLKNGAKADVRMTPANQKVLDLLHGNVTYKGNDTAALDAAVRREAAILLRERGYLPKTEYNLTFDCADTKRAADLSAFCLTEDLNRNFPFVSAMCEGYKVQVSVNSRDPRQQAGVERFIAASGCVPSVPVVSPFQDLRGVNRICYLLDNGQTVDGYHQRPATGLSNQYMLDKRDGRLFIRPYHSDLDRSGPFFASADKVDGPLVRVHAGYQVNADYNRVSGTSIYRKQNTYGHPEWMVRCKVDGIQELGRNLPPGLNRIVNNLTDGGQKKPDNRTWHLLKQYAAVTAFADLLQGAHLQQTAGHKR